VVFSKKILSPIRTKLLSVIVLGQLNLGTVKVPAIEPIFCCGSQKYGFFEFRPLNPFFAVGAKKYGFFGFLGFSLKRKNSGNFFSIQKKRLDEGNPTMQNSLPYVA
jgi:hypothetical protein